MPEEGGESGAREGIIVTELSWTHVELEGWGAPVVSAYTELDMPASKITQTTAVSTVTRGRTYTSSMSFQSYGYNMYTHFQLPEVNCDEAGAEVDATTSHTATWGIKWAVETVGWAVTRGHGSCPPVPPTAHFTMSANGVTANDNELLDVEARKGTTVNVTLDGRGSKFDAPIVEYRWYVNGRAAGSGVSTTIGVSTNNVGIRLVVRDANGLTGFADAAIAIRFIDDETTDDGEDDPPPPTTPGPPGGGGGGSPPSGSPPPPMTEPTGSGSAGTICENVYYPEWWWDYNTNTGGYRYVYDHTECRSLNAENRTPRMTKPMSVSSTRPAAAAPPRPSAPPR